MKEITLEQPIEVLKINIGDKSFSMPLASSIPFSEIAALRKAKTTDDKLEAMMDLLQKYIPEEYYKTLTSRQINQIMTAWGETSQEEAGMSPGES